MIQNTPAGTEADTHQCLTCHRATEFKYICEYCSEQFLVELWNGAFEQGIPYR